MSETPTTTAQPLAVDAKRLAPLLCCSVRQIRSLDAGGRIPSPVTIGARSRRWRLKTIDDWLQAGCPDRSTWEAMRSNGRMRK